MFIVYGCYISPNIDLAQFSDFLRKLRIDMQKHDKEIVIGGDFNAKSGIWGSKKEDKRGEMLAEWLAEEDLVVHNKGNVPTFIRGKSESFIDVTFSTKKIAKQIENWKVLEEESLSAHQHITFEIALKNRKIPKMSNSPGWRIKKENLPKMTLELKKLLSMRQDYVMSAAEISGAITEACNKSFGKKRGHPTKRPVYWWTEEVAQTRRTCLKSKRLMVRANKGADEVRKRVCQEDYRADRAKLKKTINEAKRKSWKEVISEVDNDVWGRGYRIVMKKMTPNAPAGIDDEESLEIAKSLFHTTPNIKWSKKIVSAEHITLFTAKELLDAAKKIKEKKAPGPDNIPPEVIKVVVENHTEMLVSTMNRLLTQGEFPKEWKEARLVLLEKETKAGQQVKKYRPICLLNILGKLLEQLLLVRLKEEIDRTGGLSINQHGFCKGKSTISALRAVCDKADDVKQDPRYRRKLCVLITVDVENAFNSAPWNGILGELERRNIAPYLYNMIASYFENRVLNITPRRTLEVTGGVPQGSVIGPTLWNIYYDSVLRVPMPGGVTLIAYADDLGVIVEKREVELLETIANHALHNITEWMQAKGMRLAPHKTEAVILIAGRKTKTIQVNVDGVRVNSRESVRYLGVHLDRNMTMGTHIRKVAEKANKALNNVSRLMPNVGGPREGSRRILCSIVQSILLYGASAWERAMAKQVYRNILFKIQRRACIRIISAYRTTSTKALLVIARMPPIDLMARHRAETETRKVPQDRSLADMMTKWQEDWETEDGKATWTKRLIPNIRSWFNRKHGEVDFYITQILTGHGAFRSYLCRFKLVETSACLYCEGEDNAEHTFFHCIRWNDIRQRTIQETGELTPNNLVDKMMATERNWKEVCKMAKDILKTKKSEEGHTT